MSALAEDIAALGEIGAHESGITRLAWSPELERAVAWCAERMRDVGLRVERDAAGNLIGRWEAGSGPAVLAGSHIDTVPSGGRFDGALGVLTAIDAVRRLRREGFQPARPIWVAAFMDEEGARFSTPMFGSRALSGDPIGELGDRLDAAGTSLADAMRACGRSADDLSQAARLDDVGTYVELHIEQGSQLEREQVDLGVVTAISGVYGLRVSFTGAARHAGTTPMSTRRDALIGAARLAVAVRAVFRGRADLLATVGSLTARPGAPNVIAGAATLSLDLRSLDERVLVDACVRVKNAARHIAAEEWLEVEFGDAFQNAPVEMDRRLADLLEDAARASGASTTRLVSGAGHDAMVIGRHVPAGMLFVPSADGISHAPEEHTDDRACDLGAAAFTEALRRLAGGCW